MLQYILVLEYVYHHFLTVQKSHVINHKYVPGMDGWVLCFCMSLKDKSHLEFLLNIHVMQV
jgi:hypothetical protein